MVEVEIEPLERPLLDGVRAGADRAHIDLAIVGLFQDERPLQGLAGLVDWRTSGQLTRLLDQGVCSGEEGEAVLMPGRRTLPTERLVLIGLGPRGSVDVSRAEPLAERIVSLAVGLLAREVLVALPAERGGAREPVEALFSALLGRLRELPPRVDGSADRWWVAADEGMVLRLRRLLAGPPRAAQES